MLVTPCPRLHAECRKRPTEALQLARYVSSALLVPDVLTGHVDVAIAYLSDFIPNRDKVDIVHFEGGNNVAIQPYWRTNCFDWWMAKLISLVQLQ